MINRPGVFYRQLKIFIKRHLAFVISGGAIVTFLSFLSLRYYEWGTPAMLCLIGLFSLLYSVTTTHISRLHDEKLAQLSGIQKDLINAQAKNTELVHRLLDGQAAASERINKIQDHLDKMSKRLDEKPEEKDFLQRKP